MQLFNNNPVYSWAALPNILCHGQAHFAALKNHFVLMLRRLSTTFKWMAGRAPSNTVQLISRCWTSFSSGWYIAFQKTIELIAGPCFHKHGPVLFTVLKNLSFSMLCSHLKTFKLMAGPRSPTSLVTTQLISRRWRIVSSWCYADFQQRSTERLVVLPETRSSAVTVLKKYFVWIAWSVSKIFERKAGPRFSKRGPVLFTVLKIFFVWLLCSHLETFKFMAGPRSPTSPVTAHRISRLSRKFSFWCYADFQQRLKKRLVGLPQTRS